MAETLAGLELQRAAVLRQISEWEIFAPDALPELAVVTGIRVAIATAPTIRVTVRILG